VLSQGPLTRLLAGRPHALTPGVYGRALSLGSSSMNPLAKLELFDCNGVGGQVWVTQPNGTLFNPQSGLCIDDPAGNTSNGTQLQC